MSAVLAGEGRAQFALGQADAVRRAALAAFCLDPRLRLGDGDAPFLHRLLDETFGFFAVRLLRHRMGPVATWRLLSTFPRGVLVESAPRPRQETPSIRHSATFRDGSPRRFGTARARWRAAAQRDGAGAQPAPRGSESPPCSSHCRPMAARQAPIVSSTNTQRAISACECASEA